MAKMPTVLMNKDYLLIGAAFGTMLLMDWQRRAADKDASVQLIQRQAHKDAKAIKKARQQSKDLSAAKDKITMLESKGKFATTKTATIGTAITFATFWIGSNLPGVFPVVQNACRSILKIALQ